MSELGELFSGPKWADSDAFDEVFLMWCPKPELGLLVVPQGREEEPRLIFCNLAGDGEAMFLGGADHPQASMTFAEARAALDLVEEVWTRRKGAAGGGVR